MGFIVGMQDRVDDFMRPFTFDDGQWHFKTRDMIVPLAVTEAQVNQAEEIFRWRFKIATGISWAIILGGGAWIYVQVLVHERYWTMLGILPALYLSSVAYLWANMSATRSLRRQLLDLNIRRVSSQPRESQPAWAKLPPRKVIVRQLALCWAMLAFFSGLSAWMYRNNVRALNGVSVSATVVQPPSKQQCQVAYEYAWNGQNYKDSLVSCSILQSHPIGTALVVRVDPTRPGHSIEPTQSPRPPEAIIPVFLGTVLIVATVVL